ALAEACQRFVGSVLILEPFALVSGVAVLIGEAPVPESAAEAIMAWQSLRDVVVRGSLFHHTWFHDRLNNAPCGFPPEPMPSPDSFAADKPFDGLRDWATTYARAFDSQHLWPAAVRAARLLQANRSRDWYVQDLAEAVNASPATLERSFMRVYGMTAQ